MTNRSGTSRPGFNRRVGWRKLSDPTIYRSLHVAGILGCLLGFMLFAQFEAGRAGKTDASAVRMWAGTLAASVDNKLINASLLAEELEPEVEAVLDQGLDAKSRRQAAVELRAELALRDVAGILLEDANGGARTAFGDVPPLSPAWAQSENSSTRLLGLQRIEAVQGSYILYRPDMQGPAGDRAVLVFRAEQFMEILQQSGAPSFLLSEDGDLLVSSQGSGGQTTRDDLALFEAARQVLRASERRQKALSELGRRLNEAGSVYAEENTGAGLAHILVMRAEKGPIAALYAFRTDLLYLIGPSLIAILLVLSLIQNEWRRQDRLALERGNMSARARIAGEIMSAGIIDWSVREGGISYSEKWADIFGYASPPRHEEVFDWVERIHPEDREGVRAAYEELQSGTRQDLAHTIRVRSAAGNYLTIRERARVHEDAATSDKFVVMVQTPA